MKLFIVTLISLMALGAQANSDQSVVKCFRVNGVKAMIQASPDKVLIDYDLKSHAGYTKEQGVPSSYEIKGDKINIDVFLESVGDGSDARIQIGPRAISIQGLSSNGTPLEEPQIFRVVKCPF